MSSINIRVNTGLQITTDYDLAKIFVWNNRYENDSYVNNSNYNPVTILAGTVMGRITTTGYVQPSSASAVDGSQRPIGILANDVVQLAGGTSKKVSLCVSGDVAAEQLIFFFGDTLETVSDGRRFKDRIQADSVGLKLVYRTEMSGFDN